MSRHPWISNTVWDSERGYIGMIKHILDYGIQTTDRTGIGCIKTFDNKIVYDVGGGDFPFSTIRPAPLRMAFEEFWMFMRGETDTKKTFSTRLLYPCSCSLGKPKCSYLETRDFMNPNIVIVPTTTTILSSFPDM